MGHLYDSNYTVRKAAADVLGKLGDIRSVDLLIALLNDPEGDVRKAAAESLGKLGDIRAVNPLITVLRDYNADVRKAAVDALGKLGTKINNLEIEIGHLYDSNYAVRIAAADILGKLGDIQALYPLIALLKDSFADVRKAAVDALGKLDDPHIVTPLIAVLNDDVYLVRKAAAKSLGLFHSKGNSLQINRKKIIQIINLKAIHADHHVDTPSHIDREKYRDCSGHTDINPQNYHSHHYTNEMDESQIPW
jgi:HEAT repeats/PBS lyase HEAT-like repeat